MNPVFDVQRERMVAQQLRARGILDARILDAFGTLPRHLFVPGELEEEAYADHPLPIGHGQTISQPYIVAFMTQALELGGDERVLEVGAGSGYQAAVLARLARQVHAVELVPELAERAARLLRSLQLSNVWVHTGDASQGWQAFAPYDAIVVSAAAPHVPRPLLEQLAPDGRMIIPVGRTGFQMLELWRRQGDAWTHTDLLAVSFVPLRGRGGV